MPNIQLSEIKKLRTQTGAGMMDCKKALQDANGNFEEAVKILRKKGQEVVAKKAGREDSEGIIDTYIHANKKIGTMIQVSCETDFVARNEEFQKMVHDIAVQIAASDPICISPDEVPEEKLKEQRELCQEEIKNKPENIAQKIIDGKVKKYCHEVSLLKQPLVKDPDKTIEDLITETTAKLGEKIEVKRFVRYEI